MLRSWLLVPADNDAKLAKAAGAGADVVVVDLANVPERSKQEARDRAVLFLNQQSRQLVGKPFERWVRINPVGSMHWKEDLEAVMAVPPNGIVLPRALGPDQVQLVAAEIYELEQGGPAKHNSVRIVPQVGDAPEAALAIPGFSKDPHPRILGLSWDVSALVASSHMAGPENDAVRAVRAQLLLTAKVRGLMAIESGTNIVRNEDTLRNVVKRARVTGFDAMMALHPAQVPVIEELMATSEDELAVARSIVTAFELHPLAQVLTVDGLIVDRVGLDRAKQLLGDEA
ncbi:HpcH/HpaI aldolase/citrate lyase family protein [Parerythrobacter jejuensis]|uniref:CoA ester lyase n=1 Tax=Parerythrobacter jejuensis TaxID=795812 RepID=A0A845AMH1_9SPHN|nr:aldolase/citrate lyase family protein [Parerythrobacter jejuensis]MXP31460.1 CoA ester lyase [Parerythrobacter jejuensis]